MQKFFQAPWQLKDLFKISAITFLTIGGALAGLNFLLPPGIPETTTTTASGANAVSAALLLLLQWVIMLAPLLYFTAKNYKLRASHFGFEKIKITKLITETLRGYALFLGISILIGIFILYTNIKIPGYQVQERILPLFGTTPLDLSIAFLVIVILAPVVEEVFFRGFIMRTLVDRVGKYTGSIFSALLFAIFHFQFQTIIPLFILGMILSGIMLRTRSIWGPIAFHVFNNAIAFTVEYLILKDVISLEKVL